MSGATDCQEDLMQLRVNQTDAARKEQAFRAEPRAPLALFGSQEDEARRDADDDNDGDLLPLLRALDHLG